MLQVRVSSCQFHIIRRLLQRTGKGTQNRDLYRQHVLICSKRQMHLSQVASPSRVNWHMLQSSSERFLFSTDILAYVLLAKAKSKLSVHSSLLNENAYTTNRALATMYTKFRGSPSLRQGMGLSSGGKWWEAVTNYWRRGLL